MTTAPETTNQLSSQNSARQFIEYIHQGIECWIKAGSLLVERTAVDDTFRDKIMEMCPEITEETLDNFERIGLKLVHPKLLISDCPGAKRLRKMSYNIQERYIEKPIPLLVHTENGWETLNVSYLNLTRQQAEQVFGLDGIRTNAAQRAWVEDRNIKKLPAPKLDEPYRVVKDTVVFMGGCTLTLAQLAELVAKMSQK